MSKKTNNISNKSQSAISSPKNTLFNYFTKSPANPAKKDSGKACAVSNESLENEEEMKMEAKTKSQNGASAKKTRVKNDEKKAFLDSGEELENEMAAENNLLKQQDDPADGLPVKRKFDDSNSADVEDDKRTDDSDNDASEFGGRRAKKRRVIIDDSSEEDIMDFEPDEEEEYIPKSSESDTDSDSDSDDNNDSIKQNSVKRAGKLIDNTGRFAVSKKDVSEKRKSEDQTAKQSESIVEITETTSEHIAVKLQNIIAKSRKSGKDNKKVIAKIDDNLPSTSSAKLDEPKQWPHQKLDFLQPHRIKDRDGRRPGDTDYDSSTLQVPEAFLKTLSPALRQWWNTKSQYFDCVLFFKVGKFYELYHMDADIGVRELGCTYMRGEFAHSGFPEVSFDRMCSILVEKGYKVARIEQTETPDMMTERCKGTKCVKADRVVRREVCQIINSGTQVYGSQCQITSAYQTKYMMAIVELEKSPNAYNYGICFLDTSIGDCYLGEFEDDRNCSRLQTLFSHHMPVLVVHEKKTFSVQLTKIMRTVLSSVQKEQWPSNGCMACSAERTLKMLAEDYYSVTESSNKSAWPKLLRSMQSENDHLGLTPHPNATQALKALGLCLNLMKKFQIAMKVIPMLQYHLYVPPDNAGKLPKESFSLVLAEQAKQQHMVLDATAIANLHILGEKNSLQATLDYCCTKFGKRLLHSWLCAPSCILSVIEERQQAVSDLIERSSIRQELKGLFCKLPDFERYLAQIHYFGSKIVQDNHPDGRAILFEEKTYNKNKIKNFIAVLNGFERLLKLPSILRDCEAPLLCKLSQLKEDGGELPDMSKPINFFKEAFNHTSAADTGIIAPETGADADYDAVSLKINKINEELQEYLIKQEEFFGCRLNYFGTDRKRFQLEVPEKYAHKANSVYKLEGSRKGSKPVRRFTTDETKNFLKRMQQAEEERNNILKDISRRMFEKFSHYYDIWKDCTRGVACLDVLNAFAEYGIQQSVLCVPELKYSSAAEHPFIDITDGYHPCSFIDDYIPNDITLGSKGVAPISILTGPNMGGKSTLMRQIGLLVVMAQIGAHVPAKSFHLSVMDRVFTRLGAHDDMLSGQSTFFVELCDTSAILNNATSNSLVLLDELGRGTGTSDGLSIAVAVVDYVADIECCCLFSTHYYNLIEYFNEDDRVTFGHMAHMVENDDCDDPIQETVTFLYKYVSGICPKSYGFNVAKLSGMPNVIIKHGYELSKTIEATTLERRIKNNFATCVQLNAENKLTPDRIKKLNDLIIRYRKCIKKK